MIICQLDALEGMSPGTQLRTFLENFPAIRKDFISHHCIQIRSLAGVIVPQCHVDYFIKTDLKRACTVNLLELALRESGRVKEMELLCPDERCIWDLLQAEGIYASEANGGNYRAAAQTAVQALAILKDSQDLDEMARSLCLSEQAQNEAEPTIPEENWFPM